MASIMFLISIRGRVVTPERTDGPERTPGMTCADGENAQRLAFRVRDTPMANAAGSHRTRHDGPDDGLMRSNMIVYLLRLIEAWSLVAGFLVRSDGVWPLVVAVARLTKGYFGAQSGSSMLLLRPITLCVWEGGSWEP
jgi:hypothetical protein